MGKARPSVIVRALVSSATPPAGQAHICHWLVKTRLFRGHVRSAWHGRAQPEQKHTPTKASCAGLFQAAVSHFANWAAACLLFSPSRGILM